MTTIPPISQWRWIPLVSATGLGAVVGWLIAGTGVWAMIAAVVGLSVASMIVLLEVRPLVAAPVGIGAGIGAYIGATVVGALCEPTGCPAFAATASATTGLGTLVGVGLVVSLVAQSFDEYRVSRSRGTPPSTSSCSVDDRPDS